MSRLFDRNRIHVKPLRERDSRLDVGRDLVNPDRYETRLPEEAAAAVARAAEEVRRARGAARPVILAYGAHAIKNGLAPVFIRLMERSLVTHLATNGAGIIHDWEFAFQGATGEDVRRYAAEGQFGLWEETGAYLNLALQVGAYEGLGYGEAVGAMIAHDGLRIPNEAELRDKIAEGAAPGAGPAVIEKAAAAADLLAGGREFGLRPGFRAISHPHKAASVQAAAFAVGVPSTGHPMFGHDIIYTHPWCRGAAIGRAAERDFLAFVESVSRLRGGVYLSVGSAVMSPMIFEKALSMARNVAHREGDRIDDFSIFVVDLAPSRWNWSRDGEPPTNDPAYYLRYCKTFSRMGGRMTYVSADNRDFLVSLLRALSR